MIIQNVVGIAKNHNDYKLKKNYTTLNYSKQNYLCATTENKTIVGIEITIF